MTRQNGTYLQPRHERHYICLVIIFSILFPWSIPADAKQAVRIGALSIWGTQKTHQMWQPTVDYLNKELTNYRFSLRILSLAETGAAVQNKEIDFISTNPGNYIELETAYGVTRLVTLNKRRQGTSSPHFGAVIFTRADNKEIKTLYDLRGRSFIAVKQTAFGGFQMAWRELKQHGIDPFKDFMPLSFSGFPQDNVVYAVRDKRVAAGTVRTDTLERMAKENLINLREFKIIGKKSHTNFPFLHSTPLYPEWPFAKLAHTPLKLAKQITGSLLKLPENSVAAQAIQSSGWTVPLSYQPVRELMQELQIGPFHNSARLSLLLLIKKYWWLLIIIFSSTAPLLIAYIKRLKNKAQFNLRLAREEAEWNHALDFLDEPICMVDFQDRLIRANKAYYENMSTTPGQAIGEKIGKFCHPSNTAEICPVCRARKDKKDSVITLEAGDQANKNHFPVEISINIIHDKNDMPIALIQSIRDLTHIRNADLVIRQNESRMRGLLDATPDPLLIINEQGIVILVNRMFEKQFGYQADELIGKNIDLLVPEADKINHLELSKKYMQQPTARPKIPSLSLYCLHQDGHSIPVEISLSPAETEEGTLITVALRDISARLEADKELNRLASFPEHSPIPIIEFRSNGELTYLNPIARKLFPDLEKAGGKHFLLQDILSLRNELSNNQNELIRDIEINGAIYEQKVTYNPQQSLIRIYFWDITKIRDMTRQMAYQATHDSLTRLINRTEFEFRLEQALQSVEHENKQHVLCYMDLDQFKIVNDTCGHIAGDEMLKQISSLLLSNLRESDTLARLGGDEFGLLLTGCPVNTARTIAEKLRNSVEDYRFSWQDKNFKVGISIGLVPILEKGLTVSELLSAADTACYIAKEHGRNRVHTYNPKDRLSAKHTNEMNWVHRIHKALEEDRLLLYCQQILCLENPSHLYYEILIRMRGENSEIIPPLAFLPAAERYGLIAQIDKQVIEKTIKSFSVPELANIHLSLNLSGQTLSDHNIMNFILNTIEKYQFDATRLTFEVTETAMVANLSDALRFISTLKGLGCRFALDDFGSGFSSFAYLKNLPVDIIKIDGGFVRDLITDPINAVMVESMIYIGHNMKLQTVAEFVENVDILNALQEMGIDYVQGYGIAHPIAMSELQSIVSSGKAQKKA